MPASTSRLFWRIMVIIILCMFVPVIPFVLLGDAFEVRMESWLKAQAGASSIFGMTILLLGLDIFLPIPSSGICTFAGGMLGVLPATLASFLGLSSGCLAGFILARCFGESLILRLMSQEDYVLIKSYAEDYGMQLVAFTRPLPILAEATVLIVGAGKLSWFKFMLAMLSTNLVLALLYSILGAYLHEANALPWAILAAVLVPILLTFVAKKFMPKVLIRGENCGA